jgi:hypothetical protein
MTEATISGLHIAGYDFKLARQDSRECCQCKHLVRQLTYEVQLTNGDRLTLEHEPDRHAYKAVAYYSGGRIGALPSTSPLQAYQNLLTFLDESIERDQASATKLGELRETLRRDALEKLT